MSLKLSNRDLLIMGVILVFGWLLAQITLSFLFPTSDIPFSIPSFGAEIVVVSVLIGFTVYAQRFRDERSIQISDKAARNGFAFVLFVVPVAIIGLSATDVSFDTLLALVMIWIGAVVFAGISALYYYNK